MKIKLCNYEVSISAKHMWQDKKSKQATLELLNYLSMVLEIASEKYESDGYDESAKITYRYSDELYVICSENGLYKN